MNTLDSILSLLIPVAIAGSPVLLARKLSFAPALLSALIVCFSLSCLWAYWPYAHADMQLQAMGFDQHGVSESERLKGVPVSLHAKATLIYESNMGIGWPLKALFTMVVVLPYVLVAVALTRYSRRRADAT